MAIHEQDVNTVKKFLWQDETIKATATQRLNPAVGGALINATTVVATDKRVIIIDRESLNLRKDVETIPYDRITSVRLENGFVSSSIFLRVEGFTSQGEQGFIKPGEQEGEIPGLERADAQDLTDLINKTISGDVQGSVQKTPSAQQGSAGVIYCPKCGAKDDASAKFCKSCGAKLA